MRRISGCDGLRKTEISRILSYLATGWCPLNPDWKVRFKENRQMQSGDLLKAAEVFKVLLQLHVDKPLSFREKMLDRAPHACFEI
jgi:RNA polymerase-interacting CarD/CdnL/TRCF family regulator